MGEVPLSINLVLTPAWDFFQHESKPIPIRESLRIGSATPQESRVGLTGAQDDPTSCARPSFLVHGGTSLIRNRPRARITIGA